MTESVHAARRARVAQALRPSRGLALLPAAPEALRNGDTHHPYRFDSHFWYLSGFGEPEALLAISSGGRSELFCRARDPEHEIWDGVRLGPAAAPAALGVDAAHDIRTLDELIPKLLAEHDSVWLPFGLHEGFSARVEGWLAKVRQRERSGQRAPTALHDLRPLLDEMRLIKDAEEIGLMRRAGEISAAAHVRAMRACRPGLREYQIEAELLHAFRWEGAAGPAYPSIVAGGANACVLHHPAGDAELRDGELCLIDAGCELQGYASDITRTFPVNGRFSAPQRELYDLVLAAQEAAIEQTRPGIRKIDAHWAAVRTLSQGLLDLGLLSHDRHGSVDDVVASAAYRAFYMHGTGHWLGLDVHDVGEVLQRDEPPVEQPDGSGGLVLRPPSRRLQPGMVTTIEPGLYVRPAEGVPERWWNIGIRIEDDALVTPEGCELLTRGVPVAPNEIEALMQG